MSKPKVGDEVGEFFTGTGYPKHTKFVTYVPNGYAHGFTMHCDEGGQLKHITIENNGKHYVIVSDGDNLQVLTPKFPTKYYVGAFYKTQEFHERSKEKALLYYKMFWSIEAAEEYESELLTRHENELNVIIETWVENP